MIRFPSAPLLTIATTLLVGLSTAAARADDTVVQVALPSLLDARSVTTLTAGKLVTWTLPTDGGGLQNAFATMAVATMQGTPPANTLPNDGRFPDDGRHPDVVLNFSNDADPTAPQTHLVAPSGTFNFTMPTATYSKVFLFFNGAAGGTTIKVTFTYADGMEIQNATIPDYYADVAPDDPVIFNLASNLAKWSKTTQIAEANHHNITGAEFHPMAGKTLTAIQVDRGPNGYLVFWGATGIATTPIAGAGGAGAGGASGVGGASGASGTAGASTSGSAGAGGVSSSAGATNSAGAAALTAGAGGTNSTGGSAGAATSASGSAAIVLPAASDSGCSCRLSAADSNTPRAPWLLLSALSAYCLARKRRRPARR